MSMCIVIFMLLEGSICYDQCILLAKLLALALPHLYFKTKLVKSYLLTFYFCILVPCDERTSFFGVSSRRSVGHHRTS